MTIVFYIEPLKTFSSGMPHRGMLKELVRIRKHDFFILVIRKGEVPDFFQDFLNELKKLKNWSLFKEKKSTTISNILAFFKFKNHCKLKAKGDIYLNVDANYLGDTSKPQIITVHDLSSVKTNSTSSIPYFKRFSRKFAILNGIKNADHIVAISEFTKDDIKQNINRKTPITVIYNGIDPLWHNCNPTKYNRQDNYWIWYGAYSKRKNLKNLVLAYEELLIDNKSMRKSIPKIKFIGKKNEYYRTIKSLAEKSKILEQQISFVQSNNIKELINEVANSSGLLFPSLYEGFGLPIIEAYSLGVPVLTSNSSSMPEISGGQALLVNPADITDIKKGLLSLFTNTTDIKSDILKKWSRTFTFEKSALQYSAIIEKVYKNYE